MNALSMAVGPTQNQAWAETLRTGTNASVGGGVPPASGAPPGAESVGAQQGVIPVQPNAEGNVPDLLGEATQWTASTDSRSAAAKQIVLGAPSGQPVPGWDGDASEYPVSGKAPGQWTLGDVTKLLGNSAFATSQTGESVTLADAVTKSATQKDVPEPVKMLALKWLSASGIASSSTVTANTAPTSTPTTSTDNAEGASQQASSANLGLLVDPAIGEALGLTSVSVEVAGAEAPSADQAAIKTPEASASATPIAFEVAPVEATEVPLNLDTAQSLKVKPDQNQNAAITDSENPGQKVKPDQNRNAAISSSENPGQKVKPDQNRNAAISDSENPGQKVKPDQYQNAAISDSENPGQKVKPDQYQNAAITDSENPGQKVKPDQNRNAAISSSENPGQKVKPDQNQNAAITDSENPGQKVKPDQTRGATAQIEATGEAKIAAKVSGSKSKSSIDATSETDATTQSANAVPQSQAVAASAKPEVDNSKAKLDVQTAQRVTRKTSEALDALISTRKASAVTVRLEPDDLGEVIVKVRAFGPKFDADIQASNEQVHQALQENRAELVQTVQSRGLTVGSLNVTHEASSNTTGQGTAQQQASQQQSAKQDYERLNNVWMAQGTNWAGTEATTANSSANRNGVDYLA